MRARRPPHLDAVQGLLLGSQGIALLIQQQLPLHVRQAATWRPQQLLLPLLLLPQQQLLLLLLLPAAQQTARAFSGNLSLPAFHKTACISNKCCIPAIA